MASGLVMIVLAATAVAGATSATGGGKYQEPCSGPTVTVGFVGIESTGTTGDMGRFTYRSSDKQFANVQIDCVRVDGDRTYLSGFVMVSNFLSKWTPFLGLVIDRGEPEQDSVFADFFAQDTCDTVQETSLYDLVEGIIRVRARQKY